GASMPERSFAPCRYRGARKRVGGAGGEAMVPRVGRVRRATYAVLAVGAAGVLILAGLIAYAAFTLPRAPVATADLPSSAVVYATDAGETLAVRGAYRGDPIAADHLPPNLAKAVVAIEDRRFHEHYGIDP